MMRFEYQSPDGSIYEIEAPSEQAASAIIQQNFAPQQPSNRGVAGPAPDNTPLASQDWQELSRRLAKAEAESVGPMRPQDREAVRQMEARRQGDLYGNSLGKDRNVEVGLKSALNTFALSAPQAIQAKFMQDQLPYAEAHEFVKAVDEAGARNNPTGAIAGTVAGALGQGLILPVGGAASAAARIGQAGVMGAGLAGAESAIRNRADMGEVASDMGKGAAFGAAGGVAGEAIANAIGGATRFGRNVGTQFSAPSREALSAAKTANYAAAELPNTYVSQQAVQQLAKDALTNLEKGGGRKILAPQAHGVLADLEDLAARPNMPRISLQDIEDVRRVANKTGNKLTALQDYAGGQSIRGSIDKFLDNLSPGQIVAGNPATSIPALQSARLASAAETRSNTVNKALEKAERQASKGGSGANLDNAIRQRFASLLDNENKTRGFSKSELDQMQRIVEGSGTQNLLRLVGKLDATGVIPIGVGGGAIYGAGKAAGLEDKEALALAGGGILAGKGARKGAEALSQRNVGVLDNMIRARGAGQQVANPNALPDIAAQLRRLIAATSAASYPAYASGKP